MSLAPKYFMWVDGSIGNLSDYWVDLSVYGEDFSERRVESWASEDWDDGDEHHHEDIPVFEHIDTGIPPNFTIKDIGIFQGSAKIATVPINATLVNGDSLELTHTIKYMPDTPKSITRKD